jgi:hypothetical protein
MATTTWPIYLGLGCKKSLPTTAFLLVFAAACSITNVLLAVICLLPTM